MLKLCILFAVLSTSCIGCTAIVNDDSKLCQRVNNLEQRVAVLEAHQAK